MSSMRWVWRLSGAVLLLSPSCGSDGQGTSSAVDLTGPIGSLDEFPSRLEHIWCDTIPDCCARFGISFDDAQCREDARGAAEQTVNLNPGHAFNPARAQECLAAALEMARACVPSDKQAAAVGPACAHIKDPQNVGESCTAATNCSLTPVPGQCHEKRCARVAASAGAACGNQPDGIYDVCGDGLYCDDASNHCSPLPARGAPCVGSTLLCADGDFCVNGVCVERLALGSSCAGNVPCVVDATCHLGMCRRDGEFIGCGGTECARASTYCDDSTQTCVPLLADGASCKSSLQCPPVSWCRCLSMSCQDRQCMPKDVPAYCGRYGVY